MKPIEALAISLAYIVDADQSRRPEEKATLLSLFGKHLTKGDLTDQELEGLTRSAFSYSANHDLDKFLEEAVPILTNMQMISIYINLFEAMIVDGQIIESENAVMAKFETAFNIERETINAVREVIYVKNDTSMFLHPEHPRNERDGYLAVRYVASLDGE